MNMESRLLDAEELGKLHPALNSRWRLQWLVRSRKIPIVRIGRRIYFDENEIRKWIDENKINNQRSGI